MHCGGTVLNKNMYLSTKNSVEIFGAMQKREGIGSILNGSMKPPRERVDPAYRTLKESKRIIRKYKMRADYSVTYGCMDRTLVVITILQFLIIIGLLSQ